MTIWSYGNDQMKSERVLRVNRQVGSLQITLLRSKLHRIETGIV